MALIVNEIFYSIQGESTFSGRPCAFIRLTGCNLRCSYCDTRYAYTEGIEMEISEILNRVTEFGCPLVEVTGGEPLLQDETPHLVYQLLEAGYEVLMETNGSLDIDKIDGRCIRIVDIKCPTSNESHQNDLANIERLNPGDQIKLLIGSRTDYEYAKKIMEQIGSRLDTGHILFSPVHGKMVPAMLANWMLEDRLRVRLQLQLHKIIWPDIERGK